MGLLICFFGYRIFRLVLAIAGFIIGASFVAGVAYTLTNGNDLIVILIAALAGGIISALVLIFLYSAGVFILGALFGIILFSGVLVISNINTNPFLYIVPALMGGVMAIFLQKFTVVLITSFIGAWVAVIGALYVINTDFNPFTPEFINNISEIETYRIVLSWIALSVLGFIVQYLIFPKKNGNLISENHTKDNENSNESYTRN